MRLFVAGRDPVRNFTFKLLPIVAALLSGSLSHACTIFITRGQGHVLVGNNEDDTPGQKTCLWFRPSASIGYVLWGHKEQMPEGGMNDHGLFFDAAALPERIPVKLVPGRKSLEKYAVEPVLSHCRTVAEALRFLKQYNLVWQDKAQIFLADRTGDYAIVHGNYVISKGKDASFVLTNHRLDQGDPPNCWRRGIAQHELNSNVVHDLHLVSKILEESAQRDLSNATLYSDAIDLTSGNITIYNELRFQEPVTLNLVKELKKGRRVIDQKSLFPTPLIELIKRRGVVNGLNELQRTRRLDPTELSSIGYEFLREERTDDAISIFQAAVEKFRTAKSYSDLGNALNYIGKPEDAQVYYRRSLALNPGDYSANLMAGKQGWVTFRLMGFEFAKQVSVVSNFGHKESVPLSLEHNNGEWYGKIKLPKGAYTYALHVDDAWMTDPQNGLAVKPGKYYASLILVR